MKGRKPLIGLAVVWQTNSYFFPGSNYSEVQDCKRNEFVSGKLFYQSCCPVLIFMWGYILYTAHFLTLTKMESKFVFNPTWHGWGLLEPPWKVVKMINFVVTLTFLGHSWVSFAIEKDFWPFQIIVLPIFRCLMSC